MLSSDLKISDLEKYMSLAISKAKETKLDIPVGALILKNNEIISLVHNKKEEENRTTAHAEILAIEEANKKLSSWRLDDCIMFVTLEPCPMCAWAIMTSRIKKVYFGSYDNLYGAFSVLKMNNFGNFKTEIVGGILEEENNTLLKEYFRKLRK